MIKRAHANLKPTKDVDYPVYEKTSLALTRQSYFDKQNKEYKHGITKKHCKPYNLAKSR